MKKGRAVDRPLSSVVAYLDYKRFGVLPTSGGTFAMSSDFLNELRYIADEVAQYQMEQEKKQRR